MTKRIKRLFVLLAVFVLLSLQVVYAADLPEPSYYFYANDYANVLDSGTENHIISAAGTLDDSTTAQVVVVTVETIESGDLELYANELFNEWGIGAKAENNGVLMLIDVGGSQARIEVGYGLEGILPDGKTGRIQDEYMLPYFREGNFSEGVRQGFDAIIGEIYKEYGYEYEGAVDLEGDWESEDTQDSNNVGSIIFVIIIIILIFLDFKFTGGSFTFFLLQMLGRGGRRGGGRGGGSGGGSGGGGRSGGGGSSRSW